MSALPGGCLRGGIGGGRAHPDRSQLVGHRRQCGSIPFGQRAGMVDDDVADDAIDFGGEPGHRFDGTGVAQSHGVMPGEQRNRRLAGPLGGACGLPGRRDCARSIADGHLAPGARQTELG